MGDIRIFRVNDCDWYAAEEACDCITQIEKDQGIDYGEECPGCYPIALSDKEMKELDFIEDMPNGSI